MKIVFSNKTIVDDIKIPTNSNSNKSIQNKDDLLILKFNKNQNKEKVTYSSGLLIFIIDNLINYFCFMFMNFFVFCSLIPLDDQYLKKLLIDKEKVGEYEYDKINEYIFKRLKKYNNRLGVKNFIGCCYSYIFEPIKNCILLF